MQEGIPKNLKEIQSNSERNPKQMLLTKEKKKYSHMKYTSEI